MTAGPRLRKSTIGLVVAFVGLGALYLQIRDEPDPDAPVIGIITESTTTTSDAP